MPGWLNTLYMLEDGRALAVARQSINESVDGSQSPATAESEKVRFLVKTHSAGGAKRRPPGRPRMSPRPGILWRYNSAVKWLRRLQLYVHKVLCSEGPMFRRSFVQKVLCSEDSIFRWFYVQKVLCSEIFVQKCWIRICWLTFYLWCHPPSNKQKNGCQNHICSFFLLHFIVRFLVSDYWEVVNLCLMFFQ